MTTFIKICSHLKSAHCLSYKIVNDRLKIIELVKQLQSNYKINTP
jgi:hypothetical protein